MSRIRWPGGSKPSWTCEDGGQDLVVARPRTRAKSGLAVYIHESLQCPVPSMPAAGLAEPDRVVGPRSSQPSHQKGAVHYTVSVTRVPGPWCQSRQIRTCPRRATESESLHVSMTLAPAGTCRCNSLSLTPRLKPPISSSSLGGLCADRAVNAIMGRWRSGRLSLRTVTVHTQPAPCAGPQTRHLQKGGPARSREY